MKQKCFIKVTAGLIMTLATLLLMNITVMAEPVTITEKADFMDGDGTAALDIITGGDYSLASWDSESKTLTLNGIDLISSGDEAIILPDNANLVINGTNTIFSNFNGNGSNCSVIFGQSLTISGNGTLNIGGYGQSAISTTGEECTISGDVNINIAFEGKNLMALFGENINISGNAVVDIKLYPDNESLFSVGIAAMKNINITENAKTTIFTEVFQDSSIEMCGIGGNKIYISSSSLTDVTLRHKSVEGAYGMMTLFQNEEGDIPLTISGPGVVCVKDENTNHGYEEEENNSYAINIDAGKLQLCGNDAVLRAYGKINTKPIDEDGNELTFKFAKDYYSVYTTIPEQPVTELSFTLDGYELGADAKDIRINTVNGIVFLPVGVYSVDFGFVNSDYDINSESVEMNTFIEPFEAGTDYYFTLFFLDNAGYDISELDYNNVTLLIGDTQISAYAGKISRDINSDGADQNVYQAVFKLPQLTAPHAHDYDSTLKYDENSHWNECECGDKINVEEHTYTWVTDKEATTLEKGSKHEECTVCGYKKAAEDIPVIADEIPQTGDSLDITIWLAVLLAGAFGLIVIMSYGRKRITEH